MPKTSRKQVLAEFEKEIVRLAEKMPQKRARSAADEKKAEQLFDIWWHLDKAQGNMKPRGISEQQDQFPQHNPLVLIDRSVKLGLIDAAKAATLKDAFNAEVKAVLGRNLKPEEIEGLYKHFRNFSLFPK